MPEVEDRRVELRGTVDVHAGRSTGQDDRRRSPFGDLGGGDPIRHDLGVHVQLAAPGGRSAGRTGHRSRPRGPWRGRREPVDGVIGGGLRLTQGMHRRGTVRIGTASGSPLGAVLPDHAPRLGDRSDSGLGLLAALPNPAPPITVSDFYSRGQQPQRLPRVGRAARSVGARLVAGGDRRSCSSHSRPGWR